MPPPLLGPIIAATGSILGSTATAAAQGKTNRATRRHNQAMWAQQNIQNQANWHLQNERDDRLWGRQNERDDQVWNKQNEYNEGLWNKQNAYNEKLWHMMNDYNSPQSQMARYKEAGLNPHLIYGQSNTGGSIATAQHGTSSHDSARAGSSDISSSSQANWSPSAPTFDAHNGIMAFNSFREQSARINNLEEQNKLLVMDQTDKAVSIAGKAQSNARGAVELSMARDLYSTSVDAARENLRKIGIENDVLLQRNEREIAMNASNIREAAERIMSARGMQINTALDSQLKALDVNLKSIGVQPGDNLFIRALGQTLGPYFKKIMNSGDPYDKDDLRW